MIEPAPPARDWRPRLSAGLVRRLRQAQRRGWLVRIRLASCRYADGWPEAIDNLTAICALQHPDMVMPRSEYGFAEICDVELHAAWLLREGRRLAQVALLAPWRVAAAPGLILGDLVHGTLEVGWTLEAILPGVARRSVTVVGMADGRASLRLT